VAWQRGGARGNLSLDCLSDRAQSFWRELPSDPVGEVSYTPEPGMGSLGQQAGAMTDFRRILCPVDFDSNSLLATKVANDMAVKYGGKLYLLHVVRIPIHDMDAPVEIAAHPYWEQSAYKQLEGFARQTLADDLPHELVVKSGIPESAILEAAAELGIDLIVMSSHGLPVWRILSWAV
jgi:nucleotide-binding universal stress UspA family protein